MHGTVKKYFIGIITGDEVEYLGIPSNLFTHQQKRYEIVFLNPRRHKEENETMQVMWFASRERAQELLAVIKNGNMEYYHLKEWYNVMQVMEFDCIENIPTTNNNQQ
jgi:hypothetical protein